MACGTGIVARLVAEKVGPSGTVTGVDLNPGMIEAAQRYSSATSVNIEWHQSDVTGLPFADASFDIAFYQQGLQFFPDKPAALSEMRRVLAPGGTLVLTVWSAISPLMAAVADAAGLRRMLSGLRDDGVRAKDAVAQVSEITGLAKNRVYQVWVELGREQV